MGAEQLPAFPPLLLYAHRLIDVDDTGPHCIGAHMVSSNQCARCEAQMSTIELTRKRSEAAHAD